MAERAVVLRMRSGKPGGGKGALLSEDVCLTLARSNDLTLFQEKDLRSPASSVEGEEPRSDSNAQGGGQSASARSSRSASLSSRHTGPMSPTSVTSRQSDLMKSLMPPSGWVGSHVRTSLWQALGEDSGTTTEPSREADSRSHSLTLWGDTDLPPSSLRTLTGFERVTMAGTSKPSSIKWKTSGIRVHGDSWTRSTPVCPSDEEGCSFSPSILSDILMSSYPDKYLVSPRAAQGIIRRSEKRGKPLPPVLSHALSCITQRPSSDDGNLGVSPEPSAGETTSPPTISWRTRRLTPSEGERLMGLPDGWTIPDERYRPRKASDTDRFKVIGNGVVTTMTGWIGRRLAEYV